jgi:hypothetical protein
MNRVAIRFLRPYAQVWTIQTFATMAEAQAMIRFYASCGTQAHLA